MKPLSIKKSIKTPAVDFNPDEGKMELKGRSIPENSIEFYKPLIEWLKDYGKNPQPKTEVNVQLEYFNTSSSKCILDIFKRLETIHVNNNSEVVVNWYYEEDDEDMLEAGEDYEAILKIPFNMIEIVE